MWLMILNDFTEYFLLQRTLHLHISPVSKLFVSLQLDVPTTKEKPHSTATVFNLTNAAVGEHKSWPVLSQPDTQEEKFLKQPRAVCIKLVYFQIDTWES